MTLDAANTAKLVANVAAVRTRIAAAACAVGRSPGEVQLLPVTKSVPVAVIAALLELGLVDHGENRPERLPELALAFPAARRPRWHLIGHIQSRKLRDAVPLATCVHSVHSLELVERIEARCAEVGRVLPVLLQVNVSSESRKQGLDPADLATVLAHAQRCTHLAVQGLMTMAPLDATPAVQRATFAGLRQLRDAHRTAARALPELSMGMSADFEIAVEEGATMVRVGSALYEGLHFD